MPSDHLLGQLPPDFRVMTLGEACALGGGDVQTGPFGSQLHASDYVPSGVPVVMPQDIGDNRLLDGAIARITESDANRLARHRLRPGDIVYSRRGDVKRRAIVRDENEGWLCGTGCLRVRFGEGPVVPLWVSYYLGHPTVQEWVFRHAVGATMPNLNTKILSQLPFVVPPKDVQLSIAHILGTLDDKIELNRQMNQTLEQIAAAIFKSWFVDFDPVRAKAAGRQPEGLDAETAALFPDRLVESEIREIPAGWERSTFGDEFKATMGQSPPGETYNGTAEGLPFYQGRVDFGFRYPKRRIYCTAPTRQAAEGDTLLSVRAPVGSLNVALEPCAIGRGVAAIRHKSGGSSYTYYSLVAMAPQFEPFNGEGTVFGSVSGKDLLRLPSLAPSRSVIESFERIAASLDVRIQINELQSRTLVELRDTLLPRLLSGELRVPIDVLDEEAIPMPSQPEELLVQSHF